MNACIRESFSQLESRIPYTVSQEFYFSVIYSYFGI